MFWKKSKKEEEDQLNWHELTSENDLQKAIEESHEQPVLIYKHSTRCSISGMALNRLERDWSKEMEHIKAYYLDLINYRETSNAIAETFNVYHESPQVILIKDGKAIYDDSHMSISADRILDNA